ncbi:hypothetical protein HNR65_003440 [Desulfosalsimonas propionicica]|uniref:Uncharacterized protein n=2 Tax=Desulfosalsimonas propionicica TaxID=332175 RepID=A0A7W0HM81_9BACT|nr:hypothetical protein [Desulfosalsimonas propionicica]
MPQHVKNLFMLGSGANTQYTPQEIKQLWQKHGRQFLKHLDGLDRETSPFRMFPMIFSLLNSDETRERARFGL